MNEFMDEESEIVELLIKVVEENQSRKILDLLNDCKDLDEARQK